MRTAPALAPQGGDSALYGRIDRVDQWKAGGYLRVIDYKRGGRALKMEEVYGGLQLQLMIYLAAALKKYGGKSAGAYYFAVADPVPLSDTRDPQEADALRKKNLRLDGVFPDDPESCAPWLRSAGGHEGAPHQGRRVL